MNSHDSSVHLNTVKPGVSYPPRYLYPPSYIWHNTPKYFMSTEKITAYYCILASCYCIYYLIVFLPVTIMKQQLTTTTSDANDICDGYILVLRSISKVEAATCMLVVERLSS